MNGLQSVTISLGKRIRCLPTCPQGTRGRTISRRLTRALSTGAEDPATEPPLLPTPSFHTQLDPTSVRRILKDSIDAVKRLQSVLDYVVREYEVARSTTESHAASAPPAEPLDSSLTGLDPIPVPSPQSPRGGLLRAIDQKKGGLIWDKFMQTYVNFLLTRSIKGNDFSALLLSLKADDYLDLKARHRLAADGRTYYLISEEKAFAEFKRKLVTVVKAMQKAGHKLTVREYGHLIDCARAGGDPKMAEVYWNDMCGREYLVDTWAYNSFMAAVSGGAAYEREYKVNEKSVDHRSKRKDLYVTRAKRIFRRMLDKGVSPNSMTFDILMLATARMGDLHSVSVTLKEIWGVDVDGLPNEAAVRDKESRVTIRPDSPLYPTGHTLLAIATAFCQNGSVDKAIRTVDHLSRLYDIPIPVPVWVTLLNWTYVYSRQRTDHEHSLPAAALEGLWNIMTGEPYRISPTVDMYDYIIRSYLWRRMPGMAEQMMESVMTSLVRSIVWRARSIETRMAHGRIVRGPEDAGEMVEKKVTYTADEIAALRKQVAALVRDEHRLRSMLRRWTELMVVGKDLEVTAFGTQEVPRIIEKWGCFLGRDVVYVLRSGHVELDLAKENEEELWEVITTRKRRWMYMALGTGAKEEDDFF
ncbi:mitochondrial ATPase expression-domain-containing protein [Tricharina praecox]|uniref:mitochondrial ATPase expression-domain-containing protein n=1 Tax=Tricharina praecox TaxID=43433 RepID=UPI0022207526|nr:mitochondrial ATPase expression-domain-containing protein [Tricharina praecox]KAI5842309.1 mitochondrial ATPase expression-domain-containing protein [Tricharina praecox]